MAAQALIRFSTREGRATPPSRPKSFSMHCSYFPLVCHRSESRRAWESLNISRNHQIFKGRAILIDLCLMPPGEAAAQTIVHSFDGDSGPTLAQCQAGPSHCGRQPEMNVAANGKQVLQVTWQNVRVYDYGGTLLKS